MEILADPFLFSSDYVAHLDGFSVIPGGWLNGHYIQLGYQLADSISGFAYSFGGTCLILFVMNLIPGLSLRASEEDEINGIDDAEIGEFAVRAPLVPFLNFSRDANIVAYSMTLWNINVITSTVILATQAPERKTQSSQACELSSRPWLYLIVMSPNLDLIILILKIFY